MKILNKQDVIDILYGCAVLGTGGGGSLTEGLQIMEDDFINNREIKLLDVNEVADDAYIATPYGCGAPKKEHEELDEKYKNLPKIKDIPSILALKKLEDYLGQKFVAVSSTELGGANTAEALHIAALLGIPIMDADPAGRSVPELSHSTYFIKSVPIAPMAVATEFGDVIILPDVVDDLRAEEIVRAIAVVSNNLVGVVDHPTTAKIYRNSVIIGAISYAQKIGQILRIAKEQGKNIAHEIAQSENGKILFEGIIDKMPWECTGAFNIGEIHIKGTGIYINDVYKIWFKNENLMSYKNNKIDVTCPDLICLFGKDGLPITNPDAKIGAEVVVIALPAPDIWKTKEGLACFSPRYFGFNIDYAPFEI